jgi:hypothetical protein
MDYSKVWLGTVGGGAGFSVIGGMSVYQLNLWNMAGGNVPIQAVIVGKRLGLTVQAEAAHAICILTGVKSASEFTTIKSSGIDFALAAGIRVDSLFKSSAKAAKMIAKGATKVGHSWASSEASKAGVRGLMDDVDFDMSKPQFYLLPTPLGVGAGAGIWYEWQELHKTGSDLAWKYSDPAWRVSGIGKELKLEVTGIPETDGTHVNFRIRKDTWGYDDAYRFADAGNAKTFFGGTNETNLNGVVKDRQLWMRGARTAGVPLGQMKVIGKLETKMMSVPETDHMDRNKIVKIGVTVTKGKGNATSLWESDNYAKVKFNDGGQMYSAVDGLWRR